MADERIGKALRDVPVPDEAGAAERGLRVVRAAFEGKEPSRGRPPRLRRLGLALVAATVIFVLLLTPVGAEVRDFVKDVVEDEPNPARSLTRLPGGGELLVESGQGPWIVRADGSQRLLGDYEEATWSPHGLFVAVTDGGRLSAVDPLGNPRWTVTRPASVSDPRWSPSGYRVAYRAGGQLRVVAGDGTGDARLAEEVSPVAAAWRPGRRHVLAYSLPGERIRVVDTDRRETLFEAEAQTGGAQSLSWSSDGSRLLAVTPNRLLVFDGMGNLRRALGTQRPGGTFTAAAWEPGALRIAFLARYKGKTGPRTELGLRTLEGTRRPLLAVPGRLLDVLWSPDGSRVLTGWQGADQWFFVPVADSVPRSVTDISSQFAPGARNAGFPRVVGWVQPRR